MRKTREALRRARLALVFAALCAQAGGAGAFAQDSNSDRRYERGAAPVRYAPFGVEVLVGGRPLEELYARGRRYVEAVEGAEYELLVRNPLPVRVAVALSVDGLNTVDARHTSSWEASKWVIEPYQTIRLSGWQMSWRHARRFYFTTERDSYGARLGRKTDLGVITAVFYRELTPRRYPVVPGPPIPQEHGQTRDRSDERSRAESPTSESGRARQGAGVVAPRPDDDYAATGIGRPVDHHVSWVRLDLERRPAAEVTLRYEYRDALYRLGVLPRPRYEDGGLRRRERARGFSEPDFCPEP
ncbi:MAG: hypothetical protein M3416_21920 [Acidobacteriota bacterium]|nr:hypothetical protein [Acidobacteriota bacterium]